MKRFCSILNQLLQIFPESRVSKDGERNESGTACARIQELGSVRRDVV